MNAAARMTVAIVGSRRPQAGGIAYLRSRYETGSLQLLLLVCQQRVEILLAGLDRVGDLADRLIQRGAAAR